MNSQSSLMTSGKLFNVDYDYFNKIYSEQKTIKATALILNASIDTIRNYMRKNKIQKIYKTKYICDHNFFSNDSESSFYWAGFIAADGSISKKNKSEPFVLKIGLASKDQEHLEKFKESLRSNNPIYNYIIKNKNPNFNETKSCEIQIYSKQLCEDLYVNFKITPKKSLTLDFPEIINNENLRHFCRGYIDGDGSFSISKNKQLQFSVRGTVKFLTKLHLFIDSQCNLSTDRTVGVSNGIGIIAYSGNKIVKKIGEFLYKNSTIYLNRKAAYFI